MFFNNFKSEAYYCYVIHQNRIAVHYLFIGLDDNLIAQWNKFFKHQTNVTVLKGDLTQASCDAIVSPANSFGFMDGGVDYAISERLGWDLQLKLQEKIRNLPERELLIGKAMTIETGDESIPYLISAPTMRVPTNFNIPTSINAYLATKAAILAAKHHEAIEYVAFPGMCTGIGRMKPEIAANQMFSAFLEAELNQLPEINTFGDAQKHHFALNTEGMIYTSS